MDYEMINDAINEDDPSYNERLEDGFEILGIE